MRSPNASTNFENLQKSGWIPGTQLHIMYCHQGNFESAHLTKSSFWGENELAKLSTIDILQINKDFSAALGDRAYSKLVTLVQGDLHIKKVVGARGSPRLITKFTEDHQQDMETTSEPMVQWAMEENYPEPEEVSLGFGSVDLSTVTTNTPRVALATVAPGTEVLGGHVTPHPTHQMITVNPSQFIR